MKSSPPPTEIMTTNPWAALAASNASKLPPIPIQSQVFQWVMHGDCRAVIAATRAHPELLGSAGGRPLRIVLDESSKLFQEASLLDSAIAYGRGSVSMAWSLIREGAWPVGEADGAPGVSRREAKLSSVVLAASSTLGEVEEGLAAIASSGRKALPWPSLLSMAIKLNEYVLAGDICEAHGCRLSPLDVDAILLDDHGRKAGMFWARLFTVPVPGQKRRLKKNDNIAGPCSAEAQKRLFGFFEGELPPATIAFIWTKAIVADRPDILEWMAERQWLPNDWLALAHNQRQELWPESTPPQDPAEAARAPSLAELALVENHPKIFSALLSIPAAAAAFVANPPSANALAQITLTSALKMARNLGVDIFKPNAKGQNFLHLWALGNPGKPRDGWQSMAAISAEALGARDLQGKTPVEIQLSSMRSSGEHFEAFAKIAARIDQRAMSKAMGAAPKRKASARRL